MCVSYLKKKVSSRLCIDPCVVDVNEKGEFVRDGNWYVSHVNKTWQSKNHDTHVGVCIYAHMHDVFMLLPPSI